VTLSFQKEKGYSVLAGFLGLFLPAAQKAMAQESPILITEKDNDKTITDYEHSNIFNFTDTIKPKIVDEQKCLYLMQQLKTSPTENKLNLILEGNFLLKLPKEIN
jgi:hypothetical protein